MAIGLPLSALGSADETAPSTTAFATALHAYAERAEVLRDHALATGGVSYLDVIEAAYGPGVVTVETLEAKARWRDEHRQRFRFVTDYSKALEVASVGPLVARPDPRLQSTLVAQYESVTHSIGIAPVAADVAIFHETGHALQRATLQAGASAASRRAEQPDFLLHWTARSPSVDATALRRLEYLCSQVELEVRLQDLNRFHALLNGGRPIMGAIDSLEALGALGVVLTYEETRDAFSLGGRVLTPEEFAQARLTPAAEAAQIGVVFEDARELRIVRRLASRVAPDCWIALLAKIIFEAPGHI